MGRIARESIEEVRRANDIVELVSAYVPLKRRGAGFWANCPFHDEKTPSFQVSPARQVYKCFGCGVFGSAIDFVMAYEKLEFVEAVEKLASRAGVTLRYEGTGPSQADRSLRQKALEIMNWAQRGFVANLARHDGARKYLEDRGLGGEVAENWGLGYAPDEWTRVTDAARSKFDDEALLATGICRKNDEGRWYDFFRGRVTFPIRDAQGRIVGFGARLLDPDAKAQKYVNSAEGLLFHKSRLLYAVDRLAESRRLKATGRALIMEGYTDVIAAHVHGFDNAVAPLGTALTLEQLALLRRYAPRLTLVLDGDSAGIKAAERAVDLVLEAGMDADVAVLPDEMDPFDLLRARGAAAFEAALAAAKDAFAFKLDTLGARYDLRRPVEAEKALGELAQTLARAESQSLRELYAKTAAARLGLREAVVVAAVEKARRDIEAQTNRSQAAAEPRPAARPAGGVAAQYERELLRRLLENGAALKAAAEIVEPKDFHSAALGEVYREMLNAVDEHGQAVPGALLGGLGPEARAELARIEELMYLPTDHSTGPGADQTVRLLEELRRFAAARGEPVVAAKGSTQELELLRQKKGQQARRRRGP
ncbi:MAG: DNA primase [Planctomycetes bacterium]|nr:DNA primase [Planctomycetota bacterium]